MQGLISLFVCLFVCLFVFRELLFDDEGNLKKLGDNITNPQYAKTLEDIRDDPESFYSGQLASKIVRDIRLRGGIITAQDLKDYKVIRKKALVNKLGNMTWYTVPPPSSGPVITLILNILKGMLFIYSYICVLEDSYILADARHSFLS